MVDESCRVSLQGGVNDKVIVHPEHVAADAAAVVVLLPVVGEHGPDLLTGVLNHHLSPGSPDTDSFLALWFNRGTGFKPEIQYF